MANDNVPASGRTGSSPNSPEFEDVFEGVVGALGVGAGAGSFTTRVVDAVQASEPKTNFRLVPMELGITNGPDHDVAAIPIFEMENVAFPAGVTRR